MDYNNERIELALLEMYTLEAATASVGNKTLALINNLRAKIKEGNTEFIFNAATGRTIDKVLKKLQKAKINKDISFYSMVDIKYFKDSIKLLEQSIHAFKSEKLDENALAKVKLNLERIYRQDNKKRHTIPLSELKLDKFIKERQEFIESTKDGKLVSLLTDIEKEISTIANSEERFPGEVKYLNSLASATSLVSSRLISYINLYKQDLKNIENYAKSQENISEMTDMKLDKEIVIESAELQLLLTEGDTEAASEKGESLLSKMKKSLAEKIKSLKSIFSKKSKDIVQAKNADGTITTKLVNPEYLTAFNKAYTANVKALKKVFTTKSFDDEYEELLGDACELFDKLSKIEMTTVETIDPVDAVNAMHKLGGEVLDKLKELEGVLDHITKVVKHVVDNGNEEDTKELRAQLAALYMVQKGIYADTEKLFNCFMDIRDAISKAIED